MGIIADLSKYQGTIDFAKLAKVVDGVILRVQAGSSYADPKYKEYAAGCKANGIKFGTYAYFKGISVPDAIQESKDCLARTDKDSLFTVVDIEAVSMNDLVAGGQAFIDYLKKNGVAHVGIYSGESFYKTHNLGNIKSDFQWIAKYGADDGQQHVSPSLPEDDLWQFTSAGHLDGISGNVDLNVITNHVEFPFFDKPVSVVTPSVTHTVQPFGTVTINYPSGFGVNAYDVPGGSFKQRLSGGFTYSVYSEKDGCYDVGQSTWVPKDYCILKRTIIQIDYPSKYGVNAYDGPHGNYKQKVQGGLQFAVYNVIDGFYDIGQSTWVPVDCIKVIN